MKRQKCKVCGKLRLISVSVPEDWICSACRQTIQEIMESPKEGPKRACTKCKLLKKGECPFSDQERMRIIRCNKYIHKDADHDKKRWEKYEV